MTIHRSIHTLVLLAALAGLADAAPPQGRARQGCGTTKLGARSAVWSHRERQAHMPLTAYSTPASSGASFDVGQVAVLMDQGDLALPKNLLDLQGAGLRFSPTGQGYSVSRLALPLEPAVGTEIRLADDDSRPLSIPFNFSFYGSRYSALFVNSDGNVTFGQKDDASTDRNLSRLVGGPPRIAPLLTDLDPSASGTVSSLSASDHLTVSWRNVPQFSKDDRNTFQVTLWVDGRIDFAYAATIGSALEEGVVGIAPGDAAAGFAAVDLSAAAAVNGGAGALGESFRSENSIDAVAVARRFYATHPDDYQQLVVYTSRTLVSSGVVAYQLAVHQPETGLGRDPVDLSRDFGSGGTLESFVMMDALSKYPDDLRKPFVGEDSALAVLAHETGHRWLAEARFRDKNGNSTELLGRDEVHWSFFLDTDGSFLEGNDIEPQADGTFRTSGSGLRYSPFDQYLMGLREAREVPPFFFVRAPVGGPSDDGRAPLTGVPFGGTRVDVTIDDVIAAVGPRQPADSRWARPFRQAYVYVAVGVFDPAVLPKVETIREAFPAFFFAGTEGRGSVDTRLN
jgi:hypothetical protein